MIYNILLVNNEKTIADALCNMLTRQENLNVITANGADEALDIFGRNSIDLAIIDVDVEPDNSNGQSLLKTIKRTWGYCHVIIFTKVRDFDAIYTAIRQPKTQYILKSDGFTALIELVNKTLQDIRQERQAGELTIKANRQLMEANDIIKNDMFLNYIQVGYLAEGLRGINLSVDTQKNFMLVLGSCQYDNELPGYMENSHRNHKIAKMIGIYLSSHCEYEYVINKHGNLLYFIQPAMDEALDNQFSSAIKGHLEAAQENICTTENLSLSFIVDPSATWESLKERIEHCTTLLSVYYGMDDSNFIADINSQFTVGLVNKTDDDILASLPAKMIKNDIQKYLRSGDMDGCEQVLQSFKNSLGGYSIHSLEAQFIYLNAATAILSHIHSNKLVSQLATEANLHKLTQTESFQNWGAGFDYLTGVCSAIIKSQINESSTYAKKLVERITGHIRKNIFNPEHITLPYIADMVHFNPSYLSRLFKKATNISISDYIMECKLTSAKHLLADSDTKIQEIAETLGYTSQSNFARVFRKATGMTPNDYRSHSNWSGHGGRKK